MDAPETRSLERQKEGEIGGLRGFLDKVMELEGPQRIEAIIDSPNAGALVRSMPEVDFYLTVKEVGPEEALPILKLASPSQWQHVLDMELWKKDRIHPPAIGRWMKLLLACGWDCVHQWLVNIDPDLLVLILKKEIEVFIKDEEGGYTGKRPDELEDLWTLDDVYYISFRNPKHQESIQTILQILAEEELDLYRRVLDHVHWLLDSEVEEQAYKFRSARLQDHGIFPFEESISIYQYLPPRRVQSITEGKDRLLLPQPPEDVVQPSLPLVMSRGEDMIGSVLKNITDPELIDRLKMELASLGNQMMVADLMELQGKETLLEILDKTKSFLNIGLKRLGAMRPNDAIQWIRRLPLKVLFQIGFSTFLERAWRAKRIWKDVWSTPIALQRHLLGTPWEDLLKGLEQRPPVIFEDAVSLYRPPRDYEEILSLDEQLDRMETAGRIVQGLLRILDQKDLEHTLLLISSEDPAVLDWRSVPLTSFVQWSLKGRLDPRPLQLEELKEFQVSAWQEGGLRSLKESLRRGWMERILLMDLQPVSQVEALTRWLLDFLEDELRDVRPEFLEVRFVPWLILEGSQGDLKTR
jgi:hypothetical protein